MLDELGPRVVSEKEKALQTVVFRVMESLGSYMPDPNTDMVIVQYLFSSYL